MPINNNIILITNDNTVVEVLKPRLVLLREVDNILSIPYNIAIEKLESAIPETVLLYCSITEEDECLALIKKVKSNKKTTDISILLVVENFNQDFVLSAYDEGISDYMQLKTDDIEVLIRAIWSFQRNAQKRDLYKQNCLLKRLNIIDSKTGFYMNSYCKDVFENEISILKAIEKGATLMLVGLTQESKINVTFDNFVNAVKTSVRHSDVVIHGVNERFYIILPKTQLKSAFFILEKIKKSLGEQSRVLASVIDLKERSFEELDRILLSGLCEAESKGEDLIILDEDEKKNESSQDWLDKINSPQKNFKLFKQAFSKKLEKVISPVFFQMQKSYEERLFETSIEQFSTSDVSEFILKKANSVGHLRITYPGFSKINIDLMHQGLDSPENKRISIDLADLTEEKLSSLIEDFIQEFKNSTQEY